MCEPSEEVRAQYEADAFWWTMVVDQLRGITEEALERPEGYQAHVAGVMDSCSKRLISRAYGIPIRVVTEQEWRAVNERALQAEKKVRDLEETLSDYQESSR